MNLTKKLFLLAVLSLLVFVVACGDDSEVTGDSENTNESESNGTTEVEELSLTFGHHLAESHTLGQQVEMFKEVIEEKSNGQITVEVFSNGQIGDQRDLMEGLTMGTVDMTLGDTGVLANYSPDVAILELPYMFETMEDSVEVLASGLEDQLKESILESAGFRVLVIEPVAFRHTITVGQPVNSFEEMDGLRLRTLDAPYIVEAFQNYGVQPVALPTGEAISAMETGTVDGLESNSEFLTTINIWELADYVSLTNHVLTHQVITISEDLFQNLSESQRNLIIESIEETRDWYIDETIKKDTESLELMEENGMSINEIDLVPFREESQPVIDSFIEEQGLEELYQLIQEGVSN